MQTGHANFGFIDVQYLHQYYRILFLALKKVSPSNEKIPVLTKISHSVSPHRQGRLLLYPFNAIWKTLARFTFPTRSVEIISKYFLVWLWTATQFNTTKNEMSLKMLLVIWNGFLISKRKYRIWISKNESIIRITAWKGCWLLFYPKLCVDVSLCFT